MSYSESFGAPDPYLGAHGHYDGSDITLILQEGRPANAEDRAAVEEIYGDVFGPMTKKDNAFLPTLDFLRSREVDI